MRKFYNLSTTTSRNIFNGNGATKTFNVDFAFIAKSSLKVTLVTILGAEVTQTENVHYTVTGGLNSDGEPDTGAVVMVAAPPSGSKLVVERSEQYVQPTTFQRFGRIPIKVVELALDRATLLTQQLLDRTNRTMRYPSSEPLATNGVLPTIADRAGMYLAFDAVTGEPIAAAPPEGGNVVSAFMATVLDDSDAATARATLGADFVASDFLPVGLGPLPWPTASSPPGWLLCYGQAISRTDYAALFAVIGTTFGAGDGSTTFNMPDMRGRVPGGVDNIGGVSANRLVNSSSINSARHTIGGAGGADVHSLSATEGAPHHHTFPTHGGSGAVPGTAPLGQNGGASATYNGMADSGDGTPHNNVQPTMLFNFIMFAGV